MFAKLVSGASELWVVTAKSTLETKQISDMRKRMARTVDFPAAVQAVGCI